MDLNFRTPWVLFNVKDAQAHIRLNNPELLNPVTAEMMQDLITCLNYCETEASVRVVVIRGAGGNFTAGGNIKGMKERLDKGVNITKTTIRSGGEFIMRLKTLSKPTIAVIEGAVAGVGMSIALACDFSIATEAAKMVFAFVNIGFIPDGGMAYLLSRAVGTTRATQLLMSGQRFTGAEAHQWGMITQAVPPDQLEAVAGQYAKKYAEGPSVAYAQMKQLINDTCYQELGACMQREVNAQYICSCSQDHREAVNAFLEKRRPAFLGK